LVAIKRGTDECARMCQRMMDDGYCVVSLSESQFDDIGNMYDVGGKFLSQDAEKKNEHLDSKNEGMGYVDIEGIRDFIKLRVTGDRQNQFPSHPPDFKEKFSTAHSLLANIAWTLYLELVHFDPVKSDPLSRQDDVLSALKECLDDMASTSHIRYYLPPASSTTSPGGLRDVCDEHTDTGILTLILCSKVPGLQVWDRKNNRWAEIEKELIEKYKSKNPREHLVVCIMGEKIRMFANSPSLVPTLHRVMVADGVERSSLLYFMDTAK